MCTKPKWFQKLYYNETILAIKISLDFLSYESFKNSLRLSLPQDSEKSRIRISNNVLNRFFSNNQLTNLLTKVWDKYGDEALLQELIRCEFLKKEPIIAEFVIGNIIPYTSGTIIPNHLFRDYIKLKYGKVEDNLVWWLQAALRDLGFIVRANSEWILTDYRVPETAFLLLLHNNFASSLSDIQVDDIFKESFWKLIGIKNFETVEQTLKKAYLLNYLQLNSNRIRIIYHFDSLLEQKPVLNFD